MNKTLEEMLIEQCAPTLAGVKPANLFRYHMQEGLYRMVYDWNQKMRECGIRIRVLKQCKKTKDCLIYVCRWDWIMHVISQRDNSNFLRENGYKMSEKLDDVLRQLSKRLCMEQDFPHEIGIFLGYPLCDVIGFIQNKGQNYACCGHWKCYGDAAAAQKQFDRYKQCTARYKYMYEQGVPLMQMICVA